MPGVLPAVHRLRRGRGALPRGPRGRPQVADLAISEGQWAALQIPVDLAFFLRQTGAENVGAFYPGPGGATESLLDLASWAEVLDANPVLAQAEPDVRAILLRRSTGGFACYLVPVDRCYELVGSSDSRGSGSTAARTSGHGSRSSSRSSTGRPAPWTGPANRCRMADSAASTSSTSARTPTVRPRARRCCSGCGSRRPRGSRCTRSRCGHRCGSSPTGVGTTTRRRRRSSDLFGSTEPLGPDPEAAAAGVRQPPRPGFTGSTETSLALPCSYDFDVAANKYLYSLVEGGAPLLLLFSGTLFSGTSGTPDRAPDPLGQGGHRRAAGRDLARRDGPALPGHGVATARSGHLRRALPVPRRERHGRRGTRRSPGCSRRPTE